MLGDSFWEGLRTGLVAERGGRPMVMRWSAGEHCGEARGRYFIKSGVLAEWGLLPVRTTYSNANSRQSS